MASFADGKDTTMYEMGGGETKIDGYETINAAMQAIRELDLPRGAGSS